MYRNLISKSIRTTIIVIALLLCGQVCLNKAETKVANSNLNKTLDLHAMSIKLEELIQSDLSTPLDTYIGKLTGYVADCPLCGGTLGCTGQNVLKDRITTMKDDDYGVVRIVASSRSLPCGSIIRFDLPSISEQKITAIVLDRGVIGTDIDLLVETYDEAIKQVGRRQVTYDILRFGYKR